MATSPPPPKPKFSVYRNPSFSAALSAGSLKPSPSVLSIAFLASFVSASALLAVLTRECSVLDLMPRIVHVSASSSYFTTRALQVLVGLLFVATSAVLLKVMARRSAPRGLVVNKSTAGPLTRRQLGLLGLKPKQEETVASPVKPPTWQRTPPLVPIRKSSYISSPSRSPSVGVDRQLFSGSLVGASPPSAGLRMEAANGVGLSQMSPVRFYSGTPGSPWSKSGRKDIMTEEMLEELLADVAEKMTESVEQQAAATPPVSIKGFGIASPASVGSSVTNSGAARSTPLRPVRTSPGSHQKFGTPPKKGECEFPLPMSIEETVKGYESLGIFPEIENWRDRMRQWFSSVLLRPLIEKIKTSHVQVMQSAACLGISITVHQVGTDSMITPAPVNVSPIDGTREWQSTFTIDKDGMLNQLFVFLLQARDQATSHILQAGQLLPRTAVIPAIQTCINAITEHQQLNALMKGELVKGLLPQSSVCAGYTVQRVWDLAEGTCVKNYEYEVNAEVYDKAKKKWDQELPSDSHLLAYLFCCFLDHPKWMLHVEPTSYSSTQASKNPLFLGCLPPKDRSPEKYVAIISSVPSAIHPGACILGIGKQNPPIFTLYWDNKLQFALEGRTALFDAFVLLCHRIKVGFGGVVRGLHLGSSAFDLLPVLDSVEDD